MFCHYTLEVYFGGRMLKMVLQNSDSWYECILLCIMETCNFLFFPEHSEGAFELLYPFNEQKTPQYPWSFGCEPNFS